jgi:hypothetical protein
LQGKQIRRCVPRSPNCGEKEKARDSVRDDTRVVFFVGILAGELIDGIGRAFLEHE